MRFGSTDFLNLIAREGFHLRLERATPAGRVKALVKDNTGRDVALTTLDGVRAFPLEMPEEILEEFLAASFVKQDGEETDGVIVFRLTKDGINRGLNRRL